ncbi:MAG: pirin family protein [Polyangiales bacterium]
MSRRAFVAGVVGVGCAKAVEPARGQVRVPTSAALPWLSLRDHFVATVGPTSGTGPTLGALRVLADATFAPHSRFPIHGHAEVEILSIVLDGELSHHGDQAHGEVLRARSAQLISARDGMRHAEGNHLDRATRMLQIWFVPDSRGGAPAYFRRDFSARGRHRVAGDEGMPLRCAADVWWVDLEAGESTSSSHRRAVDVATCSRWISRFDLARRRGAWRRRRGRARHVGGSGGGARKRALDRHGLSAPLSRGPPSRAGRTTRQDEAGIFAPWTTRWSSRSA